jgi:hypothetical protein
MVWVAKKARKVHLCECDIYADASCANNIHGIKTTIRHNAKGGARNISRTSEPNFLPS